MSSLLLALPTHMAPILHVGQSMAATPAHLTSNGPPLPSLPVPTGPCGILATSGYHAARVIDSVPLGTRNNKHYHQYALTSAITNFTCRALSPPHNMQSPLTLIHPHHTSALGNLSLSRDNGRSIITDMQTGTLLTESNVSVTHGIATHGYMHLPSKKTRLMDTDTCQAHWIYFHHYKRSIVNPLLYSWHCTYYPCTGNWTTPPPLSP